MMVPECNRIARAPVAFGIALQYTLMDEGKDIAE
jgi:hypothetical protein